MVSRRHASFLISVLAQAAARARASRAGWILLDVCLFALATFQRTNAAFRCVRDEVDEFARWSTELHRRGFFERLRDVQSAHVNKFERCLDFFSILCAKASTTQANDVYSEDVIAFCCDDERW